MSKEIIDNCGKDVEVVVKRPLPRGESRSIYPNCPILNKSIEVAVISHEDPMTSVLCQENCPHINFHKEDEDQ